MVTAVVQTAVVRTAADSAHRAGAHDHGSCERERQGEGTAEAGATAEAAQTWWEPAAAAKKGAAMVAPVPVPGSSGLRRGPATRL